MKHRRRHQETTPFFVHVVDQSGYSRVIVLTTCFSPKCPGGGGRGGVFDGKN